MWLNRYPWPQEVVLDRGTEFMAEFSKMIQEDYGVKKKPISKRNPQANAIVERVHQTIGNMIRTFKIHKNEELPEDDPFSGVLTTVAFAIRATVHTTTRVMPMQLVFGHNVILNIQHQADWHYVKERKERMIKINNQRENAKQIPHTYQVGALVLIKNEQTLKYGSDSYLCPYPISSVHNNGTVRVQEGTITDMYNIRNVIPYKQ